MTADLSCQGLHDSTSAIWSKSSADIIICLRPPYPFLPIGSVLTSPSSPDSDVCDSRFWKVISTAMPSPPPSQPLRKFTLHPSSLTSPTSPLTLALVTSDPLALATLVLLRASLLASRTLATERLSIRDGNRKNLGERQATLNRMLEEAARLKDAERKKKREEEERREKDKMVKSNSRNGESVVAVSRPTPDTLVSPAEMEQLRLKKLKQRQSDDALMLAKEKARVETVLALVESNESQRGTNGSQSTVKSNGTIPHQHLLVDSQGDITMSDVVVPIALPPGPKSSLLVKSASTSNLNGSASSVVIDRTISSASQPTPCESFHTLRVDRYPDAHAC